MHYVTRMYLGRTRPDHSDIAPVDFDAFVRDVIAPTFTDGFTLIDATGGWSGSTGFIREPSTILEVYHTGSTAVRRKIIDVATTYRRRFGQDAVMVSTLNLSEGVQFL